MLLYFKGNVEPLFRSPFPCKILIILVEKHSILWKNLFFSRTCTCQSTGLQCPTRCTTPWSTATWTKGGLQFFMNTAMNDTVWTVWNSISYSQHNLTFYSYVGCIYYRIRLSDWDILVFMLVVYEHTCNWDNLLVGYDWIRLGLGHFILHVGCVW